VRAGTDPGLRAYTEVTQGPIDLTGLSGRIAFSARAPNAEDVYIVNADGSGVVKVTSEPFAEFDPSWVADGTRVAYRPPDRLRLDRHRDLRHRDRSDERARHHP
jgi:Tol biopolymer transport system component